MLRKNRVNFRKNGVMLRSFGVCPKNCVNKKKGLHIKERLSHPE